MKEGHFVSLPVISGWWHAQGKDHGKSINQTGSDTQKRFQLWSQRKLLEMSQATQLYHEPKMHSLIFFSQFTLIWLWGVWDICMEDCLIYKNIKVVLTLTLFDVHVKLLECSHRYLPDISFKQQLEQGGGQMFTCRHTCCLSNLSLHIQRHKNKESSVTGRYYDIWYTRKYKHQKRNDGKKHKTCRIKTDAKLYMPSTTQRQGITHQLED